MVVVLAVKGILRNQSNFQSHFRRGGWKLGEVCLLSRCFATEGAETGLKVNDYSSKEYRYNLHGFNDALLERVGRR